MRTMSGMTPQLLISDIKGRIYPYPGLQASGMKAGNFFRLKTEELIKLPAGTRLFFLPDRAPVGYDAKLQCFTVPEGFFPVSAFTPPGYSVTYNSAYEEIGRPRMLPLFSYAACAWYRGDFFVAAVKVDRDKRHDQSFIDLAKVKKNILKFRKVFRANRLVRHLEECAFQHNCPNAQNFFLSRYEAPLPVSPACNASCVGCISYQKPGRCPATQPRIKFIPTPEEVKDIAVYHITNSRNPIVSFGQGCEGEPLLAGQTIEQAIKLIRKETSKGVIHLNTNASKPRTVSRLFDAGLNSMRVSANSVRPEYYRRYYRPRGYSFQDVLKSIETAKACGGFVSLNYLTMPGFTDSRQEFEALRAFLKKYKIDMIQWRNLNFDPLRYFKELEITVSPKDSLGIRELMWILKKDFPRLKMGYFNPFRLR